MKPRTLGLIGWRVFEYCEMARRRAIDVNVLGHFCVGAKFLPRIKKQADKEGT